MCGGENWLPSWLLSFSLGLQGDMAVALEIRHNGPHS